MYFHITVRNLIFGFISVPMVHLICDVVGPEPIKVVYIHF